MNFRIIVCRYNNNNKKNRTHSNYNNDYNDKIEIYSRFDYNNNYGNKKIQDLKEYISEMYNFQVCPCNLNICNLTYNNDLELLNYEDTLLLSGIKAREIYVNISFDSKCTCSDVYKKMLKSSKKEIMNEFYEVIKNENKDKKGKKKNLEKTIQNYKNQIENYEKINNENQKKINELIKEKDSLDYKIKENENKINILLKENEKSKEEKKEFEEKLIDSNQIINDLNYKISEINDQVNYKDNIINDVNYKNEEYKENINSLKSQLNEINEEKQELSKENEEYKNIINELKGTINGLNNKNEEQDELNKKKDIEILNLVEKTLVEYKSNLEDTISKNNILEKNIQQKEQNEKELNEKINALEKEKEELNKTIDKLRNENSFLELTIKNDTNKIKELHKLGYLDNIKINDDSIIMDPKTHQIIQNKENVNIDKNIKLEDFYDVVINIKSVKDISKGWEIKMTEKGEQNFNKYKNKELIKIGVIGNSNKGKSFILSRISKIKLPSGTSIKTEGLSIKYPELEGFKNRKIVLLDSAGLETPVLNENKNIENEDRSDEDKEIDKNNNKNEINNNLENNIELKIENNENRNSENQNNENEKKANKNNDEQLTKEDENKNENDDKPKYFKEKSREKLITELFLQNYILQYSDILILVVGILTYSEQKLLNRIKTDIQKLKINRPLYIIHNLKTFYSKQQVEDYIKNNLRKSATFEVKKGHNITTQAEDVDGIYYYEKNSNPKIFHLIFANEGSDAGDYYNNFTLQFIENQFKDVTDFKTFDVIQTIKERFITHSTEIIEKKNESQKLFMIDDIISNEEILKNKIIKLKTPQKIILKRCLIDELGFSNLKGNGFEPNFNYYKKGDEKKIIVRVEAPGNSKISSKLEYSGEYTVIRLTGTKKPDKEPTNNSDNIHTTREFGEFNLDIPLKTEDYNIKNNKPKIYDKKGILILEYEYEEKSEKYEYNVQEEDEI